MRTLSEKSAGAGHRAVSLHRDCVLVCGTFHIDCLLTENRSDKTKVVK